MAANRNLILAGISGGGAAGTTLASFAPQSTAMPTSVSTPLGAAFVDAGWVSTEGLRRTVQESTQEIDAYGVTVPVRILITKSRVDFDISFLESNPVTLSLYHRLPLTGPDALVPDASGALDFTEGPARTETYAAVFDIVDGSNLVRAVVPSLTVTGRQQFQVSAGSPISYGITCTAMPGSDGVAVHWFYSLPALATPAP